MLLCGGHSVRYLYNCYYNLGVDGGGRYLGLVLILWMNWWMRWEWAWVGASAEMAVRRVCAFLSGWAPYTYNCMYYSRYRNIVDLSTLFYIRYSMLTLL